MIKFENTEVIGLEAAIRGMRNPMNSWDKSDSYYGRKPMTDIFKPITEEAYLIGPNDLDLMKRLRNAGTDHRKFMRMITVYVDITAPLYWWKEFDTYKVGTVANSCSTMHKIHAKEFTLEDFSCEHLGVFIPAEINDGEVCFQNLWVEIFYKTIDALNIARGFYNRETDPELKKKYWWQMIQLLPTSYNQKRTVMLNYEVLANIYKSRKNHKLDEWSLTNFDEPNKLPTDEFVYGFCDWIHTLPYSELITETEVVIMGIDLSSQ